MSAPPPGGPPGGYNPNRPYPQYQQQQQQQQQQQHPGMGARGMNPNMNNNPQAPLAPMQMAPGSVPMQQQPQQQPQQQQQRQQLVVNTNASAGTTANTTTTTATTPMATTPGGVAPMDTSGGGGAAPTSTTTTTTAAASGGAAATTTTPSNAAATAAASTTTTTPAKKEEPPKPDVGAITDQSVMEYLKSKGMSSAVLELQDLLKKNKKKKDGGDDGSDNDNNKKDNKKDGNKTATAASDSTTGAVTPSSIADMKEQLEREDDQARNQRTILTKSTGGGYGYDRDAAAPIAQWGVPDVPSTKIGAGNESDMGVDDAKAYLDAFCRFQLWILTLPDDPEGRNVQTPTVNVIAKAKELIAAAAANQQQESDNKNDTAAATDKTAGEDASSTNKAMSLSSMVETLHKASTTTTTTKSASGTFHLPPSAKPELLTVSFALLVHTFCELLEVGMETTAHTLRDAFRPIYDPLFGEEYRDLYHCTTTDDMVKLNTHNSQHMEALSNLKSILLQIAQYQLKEEELINQAKRGVAKDMQTQQAQRQKLQEYRQTINLLQQKHKELGARASTAFDRMYDLPFLRRARAVRWQLTLSTSAYGLLAGFLSGGGIGRSTGDTSLLAMSTLLQTKCELHVEQRDPLPFTPTAILEDSLGGKRFKGLNERVSVNWAAPLPRQEIEDEKEKQKLPFPKFHMKDEYDTERDAARDKRVVEFNRAMLVNGFRRLEALERKREFEVMENNGESSSSSTGAANSRRVLADPMEPSILLATLCANNSINAATTTATASSGSGSSKKSSSSSKKTKKSAGSAEHRKSSSSSAVNFEALWEESGIGLTCAKLCPPDGRRVAVGCDDAAVRIWDLKENNGGGEASQVLLGHKNGFPIFDVSWNKDGRTLLSAGGDGSIRLWDTMAQGPFGTVAKPTPAPATPSKKPSDKVTNASAKEALEKATKALEKAKEQPDMNVPNLQSESKTYQNGAALAVYRGHAPNTPVWSVAFAPCGYYFASAGGDATARLWTTDQPVPVRLFAGHTSHTLHSVAFHPNCNYVITGSEDKTARLWDIQTGSCVRLLTGSPSGIHKVQVDPSGQYAAGADAAGKIHLWDLGTGKKVTELRSKNVDNSGMGMVHSMSFSACGTALASGGDDRCVKVWDVRKTATEDNPVIQTPVHSFQTRRTILMDLQYTKRNLLLSIGKYITAVPIVPTVSD